MMKKSYVVPEMKVFAISADERIAACFGESHYSQVDFGCGTVLTGVDPGNCQEGVANS